MNNCDWVHYITGNIFLMLCIYSLCSVYSQVGGASLQHSAVYEEFAICLPGFLPSAPSLSAAGAKEGGFMRLEVCMQ